MTVLHFGHLGGTFQHQVYSLTSCDSMYETLTVLR